MAFLACARFAGHYANPTAVPKRQSAGGGNPAHPNAKLKT